MPSRRSHQQLGAKLGPRLAHLMAQGATAHLRQSMGVRAKIHAQGENEFWHGVNRELKTHLSPLLQLYYDQVPDDHPLKGLLRFTITQPGEGSAMIALRAAGQTLGAGIGSGVADLMAPVNQDIMSALPLQALDAVTAVGLTASGVFGFDTGAAEAAKNGINATRFQALLEGAVTWPDLASLWALRLRGLISEADALRALERQGIVDGMRAPLLELSRTLLSPADAALAVLRTEISQADGERIAAASGVAIEDFNTLVANTGEPLGLEQLLEAFRRGFIDQARLDRGIRQSRVRNEWIDVAQRLRFEPMGTADAVEAVVRNYITSAEGAAIAAQNGLEPAHWPVLLESHGRPPGHAQMLELLRRGHVTEAEVDQAVRESDIKDKYVPTLRGLTERLPAERLIVTLVQHAAMDPTEAHRLLIEQGYSATVAAAIVKGGTVQRTAGHKTLALTAILDLYETHAIDGAKARELIMALGYPAEDVALLLALQDVKREVAYRAQAINATRAGYLAGHVDEAEAEGELHAEGVSPAQATWLVDLWVIERRARRRPLSEAQVVKANTLGLLSDVEAETRLLTLGYSHGDAQILLDSEKGRSTPAP